MTRKRTACSQGSHRLKRTQEDDRTNFEFLRLPVCPDYSLLLQSAILIQIIFISSSATFSTQVCFLEWILFSIPSAMYNEERKDGRWVSHAYKFETHLSLRECSSQEAFLSLYHLTEGLFKDFSSFELMDLHTLIQGELHFF